MHINDIGNVPVEFDIDGRKFKVKRLSLLEMQGEFEAEVKSEYMDDIISMASRMKNDNERLKFQRESMKDIPKGSQLETLANEAMGSSKGGIKILYKILSKLNEITYEEVQALAANEKNKSVVETIINYISGKDVFEDKEESKDTEKKTNQTNQSQSNQLTGQKQ